METIVTKKGQVVVPKALRKKYAIEFGTKIQWIDTGTLIKVIPIPKDPVGALRGCAKGEKVTEMLLKSRKEDKDLEQQSFSS